MGEVMFKSGIPQRPRAPQVVGLNDPQAEMNAVRQIYSLLKNLSPQARARAIDYVTKLITADEESEEDKVR